MAKKKKKKTQQQFLSSEQFIKQRIGNLEMGKCYLSKNTEEDGLANLIVMRNHTGGRISACIFLVDFFCTGLKEAFPILRMDQEEFEDRFSPETLSGFKEISYEEAHNFIYGAIAYAEEAGIAPDDSWNLCKHFLKEDTEDVPFIEYTFGKDGKHFLIAESQDEADFYLPILRQHLGDNFTYIIQQPEEDEFTDNHTVADALEEVCYEDEYDFYTPYTYQTPKYPQRLVLKNKELRQLLFSQEHKYHLSPAEVKDILKLPKETLRQDLEKIILYCIGQAQSKDFNVLMEKNIDSALFHALFLLPEVGDESSLEVVLETMRQSSDISDKLFGEIREDILVPTLYCLGKDHLDRLTAFAKEKGLFTYLHCIVFTTLTYIAIHDNRREEIIGIYRDILHFAKEVMHDNATYDAVMGAFIVSELIDLGATELLEDIKPLFDMDVIDTGVCGKYASVKDNISSGPFEKDIFCGSTDINKRYTELKQLLK